ncbi:MAG: ORF6N domain-containing protein [Bacteroidales bacterium]|nr:ORF6N domain-containing protein [Bacteroidales bacterium]
MPDEVVKEKIYTIRGKNVMLDRDLAELYEVETKRLKEQVRRNIDRFPEDFMIELTEEEYGELKELMGKQSRGQHSKYPPFAFTEHGVLMLASVLNSERAIKINVQIIRIFNQMRTLLLTHQEIFRKLEELEQKGIARDEKIMIIFEYLREFEEAKQKEIEYQNRKRIGYKRKGEN